jgi:hypothetical protein
MLCLAVHKSLELSQHLITNCIAAGAFVLQLYEQHP